MTEHWLEIAKREHRLFNLVGHQNFARISADTILKMNQYKQSIQGTNRSLYEQALIEEELHSELI